MMNNHGMVGDKGVNAVSLIEEACLGTLLEHFARYGGASGLSTQEITERIGLINWLGSRISYLVVARVLVNLTRAGRAEPDLGTMNKVIWKIAESEASIRSKYSISDAKGT